MKSLLFCVFALRAWLAVAVQCPGPQAKANVRTLPNVQYKVLANDLQTPRGIVADSSNNLLVVDRGVGVRYIELDNAGGLDTCIRSSRLLVGDRELNHGIELSPDGKTLFVSSSEAVYAYDYDASRGLAANRRVIINGMYNEDHQTRTLLIPRHNPNLLLVSRGSNDNMDYGTVNIDSGRSQIRTFFIDQLLKAKSPAPYGSGLVLGWGLRNSVGVSEDPTTGFIWSVENSADNVMRQGVDIHEGNPGEELNFHGLPHVNSGLFGRNYGYPACLAIFDDSIVRNFSGGAKTGLQMKINDEKFPFIDDKWCNAVTKAPAITFASHLAPLDLKFRPNGDAAIITFHGSWNRNPADGYRLSLVRFANGAPVASSSSKTAEERLMWNADNSVCRQGKCFRPVGITFDKPGKRLFMTSDATGEIYQVAGAEAG